MDILRKLTPDELVQLKDKFEEPLTEDEFEAVLLEAIRKTNEGSDTLQQQQHRDDEDKGDEVATTATLERKKQSAPRFRELFNDIDVNGDMTVSYDEFVGYIISSAENESVVQHLNSDSVQKQYLLSSSYQSELPCSITSFRYLPDLELVCKLVKRDKHNRLSFVPTLHAIGKKGTSAAYTASPPSDGNSSPASARSKNESSTTKLQANDSSSTSSISARIKAKVQSRVQSNFGGVGAANNLSGGGSAAVTLAADSSTDLNPSQKVWAEVPHNDALIVAYEYIPPERGVVNSSTVVVCYNDHTASMYDMTRTVGLPDQVKFLKEKELRQRDRDPVPVKFQFGEAQKCVTWGSRLRHLFFGSSTGVVTSWDPDLPTWSGRERLHERHITKIATSSAEYTTLFTASLDKYIKSTDMTRGLIKWAVNLDDESDMAHKEGILNLYLDENRHQLATSGLETHVLLHSTTNPVASRQKLDDPGRPHKARIQSLFCPSDLPHQLVSSDASGIVKIWDLRMLSCIQTIDASRDERSAFDDEKRTRTTKLQTSIKHMTTFAPQSLTSVEYFPRHQQLVVNGRDSKIFTYSSTHAPTYSDDGICNAILFNPSSRSIMTFHRAVAKKWDGETGCLRGRWELFASFKSGGGSNSTSTTTNNRMNNNNSNNSNPVQQQQQQQASDNSNINSTNNNKDEMNLLLLSPCEVTSACLAFPRMRKFFVGTTHGTVVSYGFSMCTELGELDVRGYTPSWGRVVALEYLNGFRGTQGLYVLIAFAGMVVLVQDVEDVRGSLKIHGMEGALRERKATCLAVTDESSIVLVGTEGGRILVGDLMSFCLTREIQHPMIVGDITSIACNPDAGVAAVVRSMEEQVEIFANQQQQQQQLKERKKAHSRNPNHQQQDDSDFSGSQYRHRNNSNNNNYSRSDSRRESSDGSSSTNQSMNTSASVMQGSISSGGVGFNSNYNSYYYSPHHSRRISAASILLNRGDVDERDYVRAAFGLASTRAKKVLGPVCVVTDSTATVAVLTVKSGQLVDVAAVWKNKEEKRSSSPQREKEAMIQREKELKARQKKFERRRRKSNASAVSTSATTTSFGYGGGGAGGPSSSCPDLQQYHHLHHQEPKWISSRPNSAVAAYFKNEDSLSSSGFLPPPYRPAITAICMLHNSSLIVTGDEKGNISVWLMLMMTPMMKMSLPSSSGPKQQHNNNSTTYDENNMNNYNNNNNNNNNSLLIASWKAHSEEILLLRELVNVSGNDFTKIHEDGCCFGEENSSPVLASTLPRNTNNGAKSTAGPIFVSVGIDKMIHVWSTDGNKLGSLMQGRTNEVQQQQAQLHREQQEKEQVLSRNAATIAAAAAAAATAAAVNSVSSNGIVSRSQQQQAENIAATTITKANKDQQHVADSAVNNSNINNNKNNINNSNINNATSSSAVSSSSSVSHSLFPVFELANEISPSAWTITAEKILKALKRNQPDGKPPAVTTVIPHPPSSSITAMTTQKNGKTVPAGAVSTLSSSSSSTSCFDDEGDEGDNAGGVEKVVFDDDDEGDKNNVNDTKRQQQQQEQVKQLSNAAAVFLTEPQTPACVQASKSGREVQQQTHSNNSNTNSSHFISSISAITQAKKLAGIIKSTEAPLFAARRTLFVHPLQPPPDSELLSTRTTTTTTTETTPATATTSPPSAPHSSASTNFSSADLRHATTVANDSSNNKNTTTTTTTTTTNNNDRNLKRSHLMKGSLQERQKTSAVHELIGVKLPPLSASFVYHENSQQQQQQRDSNPSRPIMIQKEGPVENSTSTSTTTRTKATSPKRKSSNNTNNASGASASKLEFYSSILDNVHTTLSKRSLDKIREFEREKAEKELETTNVPERLQFNLTGRIILSGKDHTNAVNRTTDTEPSLRRL